jgi:hypothetical protein
LTERIPVAVGTDQALVSHGKILPPETCVKTSLGMAGFDIGLTDFESVSQVVAIRAGVKPERSGILAVESEPDPAGWLHCCFQSKAIQIQSIVQVLIRIEFDGRPPDHLTTDPKPPGEPVTNV